METYNKMEDEKLKKAKKALDKLIKQQEIDDLTNLANKGELVRGGIDED